MSGDIGKRVDTQISTWLWKQLRIISKAKKMTIKTAVAESIIDWCEKNETRDMKPAKRPFIIPSEATLDMLRAYNPNSDHDEVLRSIWRTMYVAAKESTCP